MTPTKWEIVYTHVRNPPGAFVLPASIRYKAPHRSTRRRETLGIIQVTATVRNPAAPDRTWDGLFLVDTGSTDCVVPANALRSVGLRPQGSRTYELADGRHSTVDIAVAQIEFMGEFVGATVGFGPDDTEPILGVTALESVGIEIDPVSQTLKRRHAVRMKTAASAALAGLPRSKARKRPEEMQLTASTNRGQAS